MIAIFGFLQTASSQETTLEELRKDIDAKNEELKKLEEEAEKYRQEVEEHQERGQSLKVEIARIDRTVTQIKRNIAATETKLKKT